MDKRLSLLMVAGKRESEVAIDDLTVKGLYHQLNTCLQALLEFGLADEPAKISIIEYEQHTDNTWKRIAKNDL